VNPHPGLAFLLSQPRGQAAVAPVSLQGRTSLCVLSVLAVSAAALFSLLLSGTRDHWSCPSLQGADARGSKSAQKRSSKSAQKSSSKSTQKRSSKALKRSSKNAFSHVGRGRICRGHATADGQSLPENNVAPLLAPDTSEEKLTGQAAKTVVMDARPMPAVRSVGIGPLAAGLGPDASKRAGRKGVNGDGT